MIIQAVNRGNQRLKETVDLGVEGSQKQVDHHQINGIGDRQKGRQILNHEIWVRFFFFWSTGHAIGFLEEGDMVYRSHSMKFKRFICREWKIKGMILTILNKDKDWDSFVFTAKEMMSGRLGADIQKILFQRKEWNWFQIISLHYCFKQITLYLICYWFMIHQIKQKILGIDIKELLHLVLRKEEKYKRAEGSSLQSITISNNFLIIALLFFCDFLLYLINMSQGQLVGKSGNKNGTENVIKKLKISVPHFDNSALIKGYSRTLIGRCMNPSKQDVKLLITMLPKIWKVEERVVGADLGLGRFQFDFEQEEDIEEVLKMQPFHFDYWMLSLVRWQPRVERNYPYEITFWVRVLGVPLQLWAIPTFENIGGAIGRVIEVDIDYGRVKVVVDGYKNLVFETEVDFHGGEHYEGDEVPVSLRYEKLFGYCRACFSLCHDIHKCPSSTEGPEKRLESQEDTDDKHRDRLASYKGVVINGIEREMHQGNDRKDYHGKGKGKMYEEEGSRWINVSEKKHERNNSGRGRYRGEERDSSYRNSYRERTRFAAHEDRSLILSSTGVRRERERSPRENFHHRERGTARRSDTSRNGRVEEAGYTKQPEPREKETPIEVRSTGDSQKEEKVELVPADDSLDLANEVLEAMNITEGDEGMEVDEKAANDVTADNATVATDVGDDFQNLTDEESEVKGAITSDSLTGGDTAGDEEIKEEGETVKGAGEGEAVKKHGTKKKSCKASTAAVGGTSKKRFVQAILSQTQSKRSLAKNSSRQEDGSKKVDEKGSSNPNPSTSK